MLLEAGASGTHNEGYIALAVLFIAGAMIVYALWDAQRALSPELVTCKNSHTGRRYAIGVIGAVLIVAGGFFLGDVILFIGVITFSWGVHLLLARSNRQEH